MTMNPPVSGLRATRRSDRPGRPAGRRPRRPLATVLGGLLVATALAVTPLVAGAMAPAAATARTPAQAAATPVADPPGAATAATPDGAFEFAMAPRNDGVVRPGQDLLLTIAATNGTASSIRGGDVEVAIGRTPLADRTAVTAWLGDDRPEVALNPLAGATIDVIPPQGTRSLDLVVDATTLGSDDLAPGVYPLLATYTSDAGATTSAAVMTVPRESDPAAPAGAVAIVVPITAEPLREGLLTAEELTVMTDAGGALREQLDAVAGTAAILAIDPAVVAAIRVLGTAAPETATAWLDDLLALPNERFALQFGDADLAVQVQAGLSQPLTVPTLSPFLDPANFVGIEPAPAPVPTPTPTTTPTPATAGATPGAPAAPEPAPTATPSPTPTETEAPEDPNAPVLPDTGALLDIGPTVGPVYWPATGTAGADVVAALGTAVDDTAPLVLVPSGTASGPVGSRAVAGEAGLLVYDSAISTALHDASSAAVPVTGDAALAAAVAYAELSPADSTLLVTVDRATARSRAELRDAISTATGLPGRTPIGFAELAAQQPVTTEIADIAPADTRIGVLDGFRSDEGQLASFATILEDPTLLTAPERADMMQLLGNAWLDEPAAWARAVAAHRAGTDTTLDAVGIVPPSNQTLLGSSAPMRFVVRNDLPWPVSVVLLAHPNDARLVVQTTTPVDAGPQQNTRVEVPVEARVGSGESSIDARLRSPTMVAIGDEVRVEVAVRAEWESIGIVVMVVLVGGMLVLGVVRTVSRMRARSAARAEARAGAEDAENAEHDGAAPDAGNPDAAAAGAADPDAADTAPDTEEPRDG